MKIINSELKYLSKNVTIVYQNKISVWKNLSKVNGFLRVDKLSINFKSKNEYLRNP